MSHQFLSDEWMAAAAAIREKYADQSTKVATSIRIAESQFITVVAEMSDGSFWSGRTETVVTMPACIDDSRL